MRLTDKFLRRDGATEKKFNEAERWFNKMSPTGQLDAIYDAWMVDNIRNKRK